MDAHTLRETVLTAVQATPGRTIDYDEVAARVVAHLPVKERASALTTIMPSYVRHVVSLARNAASPSQEPETRTAPAPGQSWKVKGLREGWRAQLEAVYSGDSGPMRLRDFGLADLKHLIGELRGQERAMAGKAARFERLLEVLEVSGAECVGALPDAVLAETLGVS